MYITQYRFCLRAQTQAFILIHQVQKDTLVFNRGPNPYNSNLNYRIMLKWGWIACVVCVNAALYSVFIKGRENAGGMDAVDSNVPNIYVGDVVAMFKLFTKAHPLVKKFHTITIMSLRRHCAAIHTSLCLLWQFVNTIQIKHQQQLLSSQTLPRGGAKSDFIKPCLFYYKIPLLVDLEII